MQGKGPGGDQITTSATSENLPIQRWFGRKQAGNLPKKRFLTEAASGLLSMTSFLTLSWIFSTALLMASRIG